jgi:hypothetical protein
VEFKDSDRLRTRLLAIDIRLFELSEELHRTQIRVHQLESEVENARLAGLLGDDADHLAELAPELERSRNRLETQRELVETVKKNQWQARVALTMTRVKERRNERLATEAQSE